MLFKSESRNAKVNFCFCFGCCNIISIQICNKIQHTVFPCVMNISHIEVHIIIVVYVSEVHLCSISGADPERGDRRN